MLAYGRFPEVCSKSTNVRHGGDYRLSTPLSLSRQADQGGKDCLVLTGYRRIVEGTFDLRSTYCWYIRNLRYLWASQNT